MKKLIITLMTVCTFLTSFAQAQAVKPNPAPKDPNAIINEYKKELTKQLKVTETLPNTPKTWKKVKSIAANLAVSYYYRGQIVGATFEEAFVIYCGLGETMTQTDVDNGDIRMVIGFAVLRPAEFIYFRHQAKSAK